MEGVKTLEMQPRGTLRRKGAWNGETAIVGTGETRLRPSSETPGVPTQGWTGSVEPYKRDPVKWARAERESERLIVPTKRSNARGGKEPYLVCGFRGR